MKTIGFAVAIAGAAQIAQVRARESETLNQCAFEEGRWRELTSQMEEWLKK